MSGLLIIFDPEDYNIFYRGNPYYEGSVGDLEKILSIAAPDVRYKDVYETLSNLCRFAESYTIPYTVTEDMCGISLYKNHFYIASANGIGFLYLKPEFNPNKHSYALEHVLGCKYIKELELLRNNPSVGICIK